MSAPFEAMPSAEEELNSSELGTKDHWNEVYTTEFENFKDHGDVGTVWFGEESMTRIVKWIQQCPLVTEKSRILDLGCGNGVLLIEMYRQGFHDLVGVDYVQTAVDLAKAIAHKGSCDITFEKADILESPLRSKCLQNKYDVCLDKGTYDAVSLHPDNAARHRALYIQNVSQLLEAGGLHILTSCNWTKEELVKHFSQDFELHHVIPTPTFQFGGVVGTREASVVFCKKS